MGNKFLIPRSQKKSTASLKLRALCAISLPNASNMSEKEIAQMIESQESRLNALASDRQNTIFTKQEGRQVLIV